MSRTTMTFKVYRNETLVDCQRFDAEVVKFGTCRAATCGSKTERSPACTRSSR
jgi:hypothetical protein